MHDNVVSIPHTLADFLTNLSRCLVDLSRALLNIPLPTLYWTSTGDVSIYNNTIQGLLPGQQGLKCTTTSGTHPTQHAIVLTVGNLGVSLLVHTTVNTLSYALVRLRDAER